MKIFKYGIWLRDFFLTLILLIFLSGLYGQERDLTQEENIGLGPGPGIEESRKLLSLPPQAAIAAIKNLSAAMATIRVSQIRHLVRKHNPDIDRVYLILRHLEELRATALAQKRLNNLLWVIALCFSLFSSFLFYVYISQRRALREVEAITKKQKAARAVPASPVYRGEE